MELRITGRYVEFTEQSSHSGNYTSASSDSANCCVTMRASEKEYSQKQN
jgi:hypothetical protein